MKESLKVFSINDLILLKRDVSIHSTSKDKYLTVPITFLRSYYDIYTSCRNEYELQT